MKRKLTSLAIAGLLLALLALPALAQVHKDEVVYARLDASGQVLAAYLVNSFEADQPDQVRDYGSYQAAQALSQLPDFSYQDGQVSFTAPQGRSSYQGQLKNHSLPWAISLSFTLDGQPVMTSQLSGAIGQLEGRLQVKINPGMKAYANALTLQLSLNLDSERCLAIQADKATQAIAGGKRTLSYVVLPGQEAEYVFSAQVRDFAMEGLQAAGIRMGMDREMYQKSAAVALAGSPLEGAVSGLMANFLDGMQGSKPLSFADARNNIRSLQFVLMGEGIPQKQADPLPEASPEPQNFWQRLLGIFKP